jgi:hypothetical protein
MMTPSSPDRTSTVGNHRVAFTTVEVDPANKLEIHPLAAVFPEVTGEDYAKLMAEIRRDGLQNSIVLLEGKILDGRARYKAVRELGTKNFSTVTWGHHLEPTSLHPWQYLFRVNLPTRRLNLCQRSVIGARLLQFLEPGERDGRHIKSGHLTEIAEKLLEISRNSVSAAYVVVTQGAPEEIALAAAGDLALSPCADQIRAGMPVEQRRESRATVSRGRKRRTGISYHGQLAYAELEQREQEREKRRRPKVLPAATLEETVEAAAVEYGAVEPVVSEEPEKPLEAKPLLELIRRPVAPTPRPSLHELLNQAVTVMPQMTGLINAITSAPPEVLAEILHYLNIDVGKLALWMIEIETAWEKLQQKNQKERA